MTCEGVSSHRWNVYQHRAPLKKPEQSCVFSEFWWFCVQTHTGHYLLIWPITRELTLRGEEAADRPNVMLGKDGDVYKLITDIVPSGRNNLGCEGQRCIKKKKEKQNRNVAILTGESNK